MLVYGLLLLFTSIIFFMVIIQRKSKDCFSVVALVSYQLASSIYCIYIFGAWQYKDSAETQPGWQRWALSFGRFFYLIAHWAFSSQYMKTSFILPRLLRQAQLEYSSSLDEGNTNHTPVPLILNISFLKSVDALLDVEKARLKSIRTRIWLCNGLMTISIGCVVFFDQFKYHWTDEHNKVGTIYKILYFSLLLMNTMILTCSVLMIRQLLKSLHNAFPNELFVGIHAINSIIYTMLVFSLTLTMLIQNQRQEQYSRLQLKKLEDMLPLLKILYYHDLWLIVILIFQLYMDIFLLYVISRFTNPNTKGIEQDTLLQRQVPSILFIQNQQLLKETYKLNLAVESEEYQLIKTRAQANEFMYYKLKELGLVSQMDLNIGVELLDFGRVQATQALHANDTMITNERDGNTTLLSSKQSVSDQVLNQVRQEFLQSNIFELMRTDTGNTGNTIRTSIVNASEDNDILTSWNNSSFQ